MLSQFYINFEHYLSYVDLKTLIFGVVLLVLLYSFLKDSKRKLKKLPPGPVGIPIFGYFPFLGKEPYKTLNKLAKKYGNVFGFYLGQKYVVILNDWEAVKDAFNQNAVANRPPDIFDSMPKGFGIVGINGTEWVHQRRFTVRVMKDIGFGRTLWEQLVQEEVDDLVKAIEGHGPSPLNVNKAFCSTFANNMMTLAFGRRLPMNHPDPKLVGEFVDTIMNAFPSLGINNFMPWFSSLLGKLGLKKNSPDLNAFSEYVTKAIKETLESSKDVDSDAFVNEYLKELELNKDKKVISSFTDSSLQGNVQSIIVGGGETSRTATIWILIAMAEYPEIQEKVHKEVDSVLGKDGRINWSDRNKLPYTYSVLMEAMRWNTIVPINTLRMTTEDIQVCGYDIPKGAIVAANYWALHNDPRYWKNPEKFIPERFLIDGGKQVNFKPDSYVPFSYGRRNCPGELIALMEVLSFFATLMQKFVVMPKEGEHVKFRTRLGLSYQARDVELRFIPRE